MAHGLPPNSWTTVVGRLSRTKKGKQFLSLLRNGCNLGCEVDESDGSLINHCNGCQLLITQLAYEMFIEEELE